MVSALLQKATAGDTMFAEGYNPPGQGEFDEERTKRFFTYFVESDVLCRLSQRTEKKTEVPGRSRIWFDSGEILCEPKKTHHKFEPSEKFSFAVSETAKRRQAKSPRSRRSKLG